MRNKFQPLALAAVGSLAVSRLAAEFAALWVFDYLRNEWNLLIPEYQRNSDAVGGDWIDMVRFQIDSREALRSFDLDNITVVKGASIPEPADFEFPYDLPEVSIHRAVEVTFDTTEGIYYQLESSVDGEEWSPVEAPFRGDGETASRFLPTRDEERRVFRVMRSESN